jgi:hypothetical protein
MMSLLRTTAILVLALSVGDRRPAFWSDDAETGGHAIRRER